MGMFTTILGPFGKSCQIKTGWDNCDTYKITDKIPWKPKSHRPGEHIDGVHLGYGECNNDTIVVIKDCTVAAILPRWWDKNLDVQIAMLKLDYGLRPPARSLWSEEAWAEKEARDKEMKEKQEKWNREHAHLSPLEKLAAATGEYMKQKMNEPSMARRILPPTPNETGARKPKWTRCIFQGSPPPPYRIWEDCLSAPVIEGLFIRATTPEDYPYSSAPNNKEDPPSLYQVAVWVDTDAEGDDVQDRYFALGKRWQFGEEGTKKSALRQCFISVEADRHMVTGLMVWNATNEWGTTHAPKTAISAQAFLAQYPPTTQAEKIKYCKICKLPVDEGGLGDVCSRCLPVVQGIEEQYSKETAELLNKEADKMAAEEEIKQQSKMLQEKLDEPGAKEKISRACHEYIMDQYRKRTFLPGDYQSIEKDLTDLINRQSRENRSNTPDFILAQFMARCLKAAEDAVNARDEFYGLHPNPGGVPANTVGRAPEFGPSPLAGAMTDWLKLQKVRKAIEEKAIAQQARHVEGKTFSFRCDQRGEAITMPASADPATHESVCPGRKNTFRYGQVPVDPAGTIITTTVSNCARCGGTHKNLNFKILSGEPIGEYTHWATCPKTGEPIALLITMQNGEKGYAPN